MLLSTSTFFTESPTGQGASAMLRIPGSQAAGTNKALGVPLCTAHS